MGSSGYHPITHNCFCGHSSGLTHSCSFQMFYHAEGWEWICKALDQSSNCTWTELDSAHVDRVCQSRLPAIPAGCCCCASGSIHAATPALDPHSHPLHRYILIPLAMHGMELHFLHAQSPALCPRRAQRISMPWKDPLQSCQCCM